MTDLKRLRFLSINISISDFLKAFRNKNISLPFHYLKKAFSQKKKVALQRKKPKPH
jgi:hypothetical protein